MIDLVSRRRFDLNQLSSLDQFEFGKFDSNQSAARAFVDYTMMTQIWTRCPNTGCAVRTGITTKMVNFSSLPNVAVPLHCAACDGEHSWKPSDAWVERSDKLVAALERLQDTLGDLNDISVHEGLALANGGKPRSANKAFAAGRISGREEARIAPVLKDAERAYARFAKVKPFWR